MIFEAMSREDVERVGKENASNTEQAFVLGDFTLYVDLQEESIARHLSKDGFWEAWVTSWFTKTIKPGFICVDAGANYGYFTRIMERLAGPSGYVYSIEANPVLHQSLAQSIQDFPMENGARVNLFNCALSDRSGSAVLKVFGNNFCNSTILDTVQDTDSKVTEIQVYKKSLADIVLRGHFVNVVKLDIEGAEQLALKGMEVLFDIGALGLVVFEVNPGVAKEKPRFIHELFYKYDISIIGYDGEEYPCTYQHVSTSEEPMLLVLRKPKS
jgi:FkbM family methyltransferase